MTRFLVSGATGFIGSRLTRRLASCGHEVAALVRATSRPPVLDPRVVLLDHDGSAASLCAALERWKPDCTIHLAARFVAQHGPADIEPLIAANVTFGCHLLEAMMLSGTRDLVAIGTTWQHYHADDYRPSSLYAATKQAFDDLIRFYVDAYEMRAITLKLSDTYGPGDERPKLIPALCRAMRDGTALALSPGEQVLDPVHVEDVLDGILLATERVARAAPASHQSFAIRGPEQLTLKALVALLEELGGATIDVTWGGRPYRPREVMRPWLGPVLPDWSARHRLRASLPELL